jgi:hypothetical protein
MKFYDLKINLYMNFFNLFCCIFFLKYFLADFTLASLGEKGLTQVKTCLKMAFSFLIHEAQLLADKEKTLFH